MPASGPVENDAGTAYLRSRLGSAGVSVVEECRDWNRTHSTYFVFGTAQRQTDILIPNSYLDDLPKNREYQAELETYVAAVAARLKCGTPELFYCVSGVPAKISVLWPFQPAATVSQVSVFALLEVTNELDGQVAKCSLDLGFWSARTVFGTVKQIVNSVRVAIDQELVAFYRRDVYQERYQRVQLDQEKQGLRRTQAETDKFLARKAYVLGLLIPDANGETWTCDPWDAEYLGESKKGLEIASRRLRALGLLESGESSEFFRPTDKLVLQETSQTAQLEIEAPRTVSRLTLPTKATLLEDIARVTEKYKVTSVLVLDLDNFKTVNDMCGHSEGDLCLDGVVKTIAEIIEGRGTLYRWGNGDEFSVLLPNCSTDEARVTAERIRSGVETSKPGGDIEVTASIGICGSDTSHPATANELLDFADKAMYESKKQGKNRVSVIVDAR